MRGSVSLYQQCSANLIVIFFNSNDFLFMGKTLKTIRDRERKAARHIRRKGNNVVDRVTMDVDGETAPKRRVRIPGILDEALYPETTANRQQVQALKTEQHLNEEALGSLAAAHGMEDDEDSGSDDGSDFRTVASKAQTNTKSVVPDSFFSKRPRGRQALRKSKSVMKAVTRQASYTTKIGKATVKQIARMREHSEAAAARAAARGTTSRFDVLTRSKTS